MSADSSSLLEWFRLTKSGTSDTIYSCLAVLSASTFLALHLNVPPPPPISESSVSVFCVKRWWAAPMMCELRRQLRWAVMVVVAPELLVSLAFSDWRAAALGHRAFRSLGQVGESFRSNMKNWTRTHASFANMGGLRFVMEKGEENIPDTALFRYDDRRRLKVLDILVNEGLAHTTMQDIIAGLDGIHAKLQRLWQRPKVPVEQSTSDIELTSLSDSVELQAETVRPPSPSLSSPSQEEYPTPRPRSIDLSESILASFYRDDEEGQVEEEVAQIPLLQNNTIAVYLNATQIAMAQLLGLLDEGPQLSKEEVEDKGKTNVMAKGFAILQLLWFAARAIIRYHQGKLSQLELASCTYVLCALLAYTLYWSKPQGVQRAVEYRVDISNTVRAVTDEDLLYLKSLGGTPFLARNFLPPFGTNNENHDPVRPIPSDISLTTFCFFGSSKGRVLLLDSDFAGVFAGFILGIIHCLAWHHEFPSWWEKWAWRLASVVITASLVPYSIVNAICTMMEIEHRQENHLPRTHVVHVLLLYTILSSYIGCRVFILFEMGRSFFR